MSISEFILNYKNFLSDLKTNDKEFMWPTILFISVIIIPAIPFFLINTNSYYNSALLIIYIIATVSMVIFLKSKFSEFAKENHLICNKCNKVIYTRKAVFKVITTDKCPKCKSIIINEN